MSGFENLDQSSAKSLRQRMFQNRVIRFGKLIGLEAPEVIIFHAVILIARVCMPVDDYNDRSLETLIEKLKDMLKAEDDAAFDIGGDLGDEWRAEDLDN